MIRALEFALTVREECNELQKTYPDFQFRMGLTMGTAFTGMVGGKERCQYACVGNRVNLAARIMSSANWGEILLDEELAQNNAFECKPKGKTLYKGISKATSTFSLIGRMQNIGKPTYDGPMIAREEESNRLREFANQVFAGEGGGLTYVYGEAGIGKSRTTHELRRQLKQEYPRISWQLCPCDQILKKPFNAYLYFLRHYFRQLGDKSPQENRLTFDQQTDTLINRLKTSDHPRAERNLRELVRTKPILAALLNLPLKDTLWEQLDARGRYQNTIAAITNLLLVIGITRKLVIELEDIHWIDEDSKLLTRDLIGKLRNYPILLLSTARPFDDGSLPVLMNPEKVKQYTLPVLKVELGALAAADVRSFAVRNLSGEVHEEFLEVLLKATNSNPFYIEQLLEYFRENNLLVKDNNQWNLRDKNIKLSNSMNSIVTARIDRLSELVRETVKAAAVIGREFDIPVLTEVLRMEFAANGSEADPRNLLKEQIALAEQGQIWSAMNELRYIFRHSLMREAAYSMQLNARLQQLHAQIAEAIEKIYFDNIGEHYVDLVFHYEQAGNEDPRSKARPGDAEGTAKGGARDTLRSLSMSAEMREALLRNVVSLLERAPLTPGGQNIDIARDNLNQYFKSNEDSDFLLNDEARAFLTEELASSPFQVSDFDARLFELKDARHIEDCLLYHNIAARVAGPGTVLDRVRRLFDWTVQHVQLVPPDSPMPEMLTSQGVAAAPTRPYDVIVRGFGSEIPGESWAERSWVFLALCRQIGVDSAMLGYSVEGSAQPYYWLCSALVDGKPYLFDTRIGMEIPSPDGQGVATLEEAATDLRVLDQLDLSEPPIPYETEAADLTKVRVFLDSSRGYFSPRMRMLQNDLAGENRMVLHRDPASQRDAWTEALGDRLESVELWELPLTVEFRLFTDPRYVQAIQFTNFYFDPQFPLLGARLRQLRGDLAEAKQEFTRARFRKDSLGRTAGCADPSCGPSGNSRVDRPVLDLLPRARPAR